MLWLLTVILSGLCFPPSAHNQQQRLLGISAGSGDHSASHRGDLHCFLQVWFRFTLLCDHCDCLRQSEPQRDHLRRIHSLEPHSLVCMSLVYDGLLVLPKVTKFVSPDLRPLLSFCSLCFSCLNSFYNS